MGLVWTVLLNGTLGIASYRAARDLFRQKAGWPRGLATVVLAWAWLTCGVEALGVAGRLRRPELLAWVLAGLAIALLGRLIRGRFESDVYPTDTKENLGWRGWSALGLVFWACLMLGTPAVLGPVKVVSDGPIYHLFFAARWWKAGSLELVAAPFGENAATYFPAVGDLWFAWLTIGWAGDPLAKVGQAPFLLVAGLTAWACARRLGASVDAATIAAGWFVTATPLLLFSWEPNVDTIFVAGYLLAVYFLLRLALRDDGAASLLLGSIAAGGALGTKAIGVVFVPPLLIIAVGLAVTRFATGAGRLGAVAAVLVGSCSMPGYFLTRNFGLTGNPLYPLHLELGGRVILAGWYGREVMRLSPYYLPVGSFGALGDTLLAVLDPRLGLFWVGALLVARLGSFGQPSTPTRRAVAGLAGLAVLNVAIFWLAVPYRTQQRFMLQALGLAVPAVALMFDRARGLRTLGLLLLAIHVLTPQGWPFSVRGAEPPWDLSPWIPNQIPALIQFPSSWGEVERALRDGSVVVGWSMIGGLGGACLVAAWLWARSLRRASPGRVGTAIAVTGFVLLASFALQAPAWPDARRRFFAPFPDYIRGWLELDQRSGPNGARIAYSGTDLPYYLQGVGLRNTVRYVNVDAHPGWLLHDYHRAASAEAGRPVTWPNTRPGWDRAHPSYPAWLANLRQQGIQLLVVTRANPDEGVHNVVPQAGGFPIERLWADTHPETFERLYGDAERDPLFRLYRLRP